jgi:hypothetical protein
MDSNRVGDRGGNISFSRAAIRTAQITGHYNEFETQNNVQFTVDGVFGTLANVANQSFAGAPGGAISACNVAIYAVWVNNTNTLAITRGALADPAKLTNGTQQIAIAMPDVVANNALIGLIKVKVGVGATFTPGTTNFNASNITTTFYDCSVMPSGPLLS